jgi:hypothetical protein
MHPWLWAGHMTQQTRIVYTRTEWEAFTAGVRLGEFDV